MVQALIGEFDVTSSVANEIVRVFPLARANHPLPGEVYFLSASEAIGSLQSSAAESSSPACGRLTRHIAVCNVLLSGENVKIRKDIFKPRDSVVSGTRMSGIRAGKSKHNSAIAGGE